MFPHARGPVIVHRLDMETSGLIVVALDEDAQRELSGQFEARIVEKAYAALLSEPAGALPGAKVGALGSLPDRGRINLPMRPDVDNRPYQTIDYTHGRESITDFQVLARETDRARVRFEPLTGRTHQLRVHARYGLNLPIVGDTLYGGQPSERLCLHATELSFLEPGTARRVGFTSATPF